MTTYKEPCGCVSDATRWIKLCPVHEAERVGREHEARLDSLQWLIDHYTRFPTEDNFRHVIERFKDVGPAANSRPAIVKWILAHAKQIQQAARAVSVNR